MPYKLAWLVPERVIFNYSYGVFTAEELFAYMHDLRELVKTSPHTVHQVSDGTQVTENKFSLADLKKAFPKNSAEKNFNWTVSANGSVIGRFFGTIVFQMMGVRGRSVATIPEGLQFLSEQDSDLPPLAEMIAAWEKLHAELVVSTG